MEEPTAYQLTLEQQFQMQLMQQSAHALSQEQILDMVAQVSRLLMVKDNVIRSLMNQLPMSPLGCEG
jgi:hypothetical protein